MIYHNNIKIYRFGNLRNIRIEVEITVEGAPGYRYGRRCCCCCCSRRSVHMDGSPCTNAITASGCSIRADSRGAAPPNSRIRLRAVAGHSWSQCSSVSGAP